MNGFTERGLNEGNFDGSDDSGSKVFKAFDAFPKTKQSYQTRTQNGTFWTILLTLVAIYLIITEWGRWFAGQTRHYYGVEKGVSHDLQLNLDIVVAMNCYDLHINLQDASGDHVLAGEKLTKDPTQWSQWRDPRTPLTKDQELMRDIPDWMREQVHQYRDVEDVHEYLRAMVGRRKFPKTPKIRKGYTDACRIYGSVEGNKVQGDFHITARGHGYMDGQKHLEHEQFNFSHIIHELSFGPFYPNIHNPLDDTRSTTDSHFHKFQYYLSVVPTIWTTDVLQVQGTTNPHTKAKRMGKTGRELPPRPEDLVFNPFEPHNTLYTNQYAVTEQNMDVSEKVNSMNAYPGIYFKYDIEPILLMISEEWGGVLGLFIRMINVVAGVMVGGGWLVSLLAWGNELVQRRARRSSDAHGLLSPQHEKQFNL